MATTIAKIDALRCFCKALCPCATDDEVTECRKVGSCAEWQDFYAALEARRLELLKRNK